MGISPKSKKNRKIVRASTYLAIGFVYRLALQMVLRSDKIALWLSDSTASPRAEYGGQFAHTSLQPVKAYVQRPAFCDRIRRQLHDAASQGEGQYTTILVVWGLGGAGKTQLVLDYLRCYRNEYKATFWIQTGSRESIERDFVHIY